MIRINLCANTRDIRKAAFAVGFGLTMGKFAGDLVKAAIDGLTAGIAKIKAEEGNEFARHLYNKTDIKYGVKRREE